MSGLEPRGMYDMNGWHQISCADSDICMDRHRHMPTDKFYVASSLTDPDGEFGNVAMFTEWWFDGLPLIRNYRGISDKERNCAHFGAFDATAAWHINEEE